MAKTSFPGRSLAVRVANDVLDHFFTLPPSDLKKLALAQRHDYRTKFGTLAKDGASVDIRDAVMIVARRVLEVKIGPEATAKFFGDKFIHIKDGFSAKDSVETTRSRR